MNKKVQKVASVYSKRFIFNIIDIMLGMMPSLAGIEECILFE
jgi:hypothetical protein